MATGNNKTASVLQNLEEVRAMIKRHKLNDYIFSVIGLIALMVGLITLMMLFVDLIYDGSAKFNLEFLSQYPSRRAAHAGLLSAWVGSMLVMTVTFITAVPMGVAAGLYLEEYAPKNWVTDIIEINVSNLAGVPSIVYGLLALGLFVYGLGLGQSIVTAGLTLGLLILPIVIVSTREAIRAIPVAIREAAYAVGATKWQVVYDHVMTTY
ncbi:MAG: Phosphate transporter, inner rane subunit PstA [Pseudomonadota bacterium]